MKTLSTIKSLALVSVLFLSASCEKNGENDNNRFAPANATNFQNLRKEALDDLVQTATFRAEDGLQFTSAKGAHINIPDNCLRDQNGNPVTGDVDLSFVEIYERGNMVVTNKPLMGKDGSGNKLPLVTGGEFKMELFQGEQKLSAGCIFSVSVPASNTGDLDNDMVLWKGNMNEDGDLEWEEANKQGREGGIEINGQHTTYDIWDMEFGWTNVDRFWSDERPKTQIKVAVPSGYDGDNAAVYLAYEDEPNVLAQLDIYDDEDDMFTEHYGFIPIGMNLHVIFVSESNGAILYAIKQATIVEDAVIHIQETALNTTSKSNLVNLINALH